MKGSKRAAVIGHPIAHSLSPKVHGYWLKKYDIDGDYVPLDVPLTDLHATLLELPSRNFIGANITIPHKLAVLDIADDVTETARRIGAANTLIFHDGHIFADNTDAYGFIQNLRQGCPEWDATFGPAAVFGAGGASRAVIVALLDAGVQEVRVANRTREKTEMLRDAFGNAVVIVDWDDADKMLIDAKTIVNTTSLGMKSNAQFPVSFEHLQSDAVVTDIVYNPLQTSFLMAAKVRGCRTVDGLGMLLHQAVPGFERWFGRRPVVDDGLRKAVLG